MRTIECDVAIFGSGAAGMTAAIVAASEGLEVSLFEKASQLGGTTATSGGAIWIPGNAQAREAGVSDSLEAARIYLRTQLGMFYQDDLMEAYLTSGAEAIDYLQRRTDVQFDYMKAPDYCTDQEGSVEEGRALAPKPFDGSLLGEHFELVQPPRPAFMVLGGLMVGRREIPMLLNPFSSISSFQNVVKILTRYMRDRTTYSRGTRLLMGNALIARALRTALRLGVKICTNHALTELIFDGNRVIGAHVKTLTDDDTCVYARRGVVLATGGFAHSAELRTRLSPTFPHRYSLASIGNTGDGAHAAEKVGAQLNSNVVSPGFWTPASISRDKAGRETLFPYGHLDRGKPGAIIVDQSGRRFVNESDSYHHVVLGMYHAKTIEPTGRAFLICDRRFIRKYGLGLVKPAPFSLRSHIRTGYLYEGKTLEHLAAQLQIDVAAFKGEVNKHNLYAKVGHDKDFKKGDSAFNRYNGDDQGQSNPCLLPIDQAPFYAIELYPCTIGTAAGLNTNTHSQALDKDGRPIEGLYACGNDMCSVMKGAYPGPGITIGPAMVFAYRAMKHIVETKSVKTSGD